MDSERLVTVASALGAQARADLVTALMGGTAHTGTELARHVGIAPSTASEHLGVLIDAGLVTVVSQGRHRYFGLAGAEVATLIESMVTAAPVPVVRPNGGRIGPARTCYDHLAGELGVRVFDRLAELGAIEIEADGAALTGTGCDLFARLEVELPSTSSRPLVRTCLDWTERRHHLGGAAGAALLATMVSRGWLRRSPQEARRLDITAAGRRSLAEELGVDAP
ncbi:MAG TPA: winged helix-turn-helix domain-containing protein [Acidimicrobiales bacterium]|nr:winged helix-turn-helix domain-containing protein [Acidimicrobiales bacterium]